jgi:uncharacterized protein YwqG
VPENFVWPLHELGSYRFIGQIDLSEMPMGYDNLPASGLLSFFYAHDEDGESFWGDPNYVRVFHFDSNEALKPFLPPESVRLGGSSRVSLELGTDVSPWPWDAFALSAWPIDEGDRDAYWDLRMRLHSGRGYLLGYPLNTSLAYDPTPGPGWSSLLTLDSDDDLEWCWHDGDWLVTFFNNQKALAGDFSDIRADAG